MVQVAPAAHPVAVAAAEVVLAVVPPAEMAAGDEDVQVSGGLGTMQPWTSTAVAVMVSVVPLLVTKLVWPMFCVPLLPSCSEMH